MLLDIQNGCTCKRQDLKVHVHTYSIYIVQSCIGFHMFIHVYTCIYKAIHVCGKYSARQTYVRTEISRLIYIKHAALDR